MTPTQQLSRPQSDREQVASLPATRMTTVPRILHLRLRGLKLSRPLQQLGHRLQAGFAPIPDSLRSCKSVFVLNKKRAKYFERFFPLFPAGLKPLRKMRFHIIGSSLVKENVKKILELGGEPVRKIDLRTAACISNKGRTRVHSQKQEVKFCVLFSSDLW